MWLQGGVHGCGGSCVVAGGHMWLLGGVCGCRGACVVARGACMFVGGVHGCRGGHAWLPGGMRVCWGCIGYDKIRSMSGRYASYWNAFLLEKLLNFRPEGLSNI